MIIRIKCILLDIIQTKKTLYKYTFRFLEAKKEADIDKQRNM